MLRLAELKRVKNQKKERKEKLHPIQSDHQRKSRWKKNRKSENKPKCSVWTDGVNDDSGRCCSGDY